MAMGRHPDGIDIPDDFAAALEDNGLHLTFGILSPSHRREHIAAINEAKKPETRQRRIEKALEMIAAKAK